MADKRYASTHEWIDLETGLIGISTFAASELGDIVHVELPEIGEKIRKGEPFGNIDSVKASSELYAPVDLVISSVNETVEDNPELVNESPEDNGWLVRIDIIPTDQCDDLADADNI